ncbi:MAG TPA: DUF4369 domain-containing protein, partial [Sphingobacteriaceae bacterium]
MKKIISLLFAAVPILASAQTGTFTINSKVGEYNAPAKAYLIYSGGATNITDSVVLKNGTFQFSGKISDPVRATLVLDTKGTGLGTLRRQRNADALALYLEQGTITLTSPDSVYKAKITGSKINADNARLQESLKEVGAKFEALNREFTAAPVQQQQQPEFRKGFQDRAEVLEKEHREVLKQFIQQNRSSAVSLDALKTYGGYFPEASEVEPLFNALDASIRSTAAGKAYAEVVKKARVTALGAQAP